jgi:hypothetical protein
MRTTLSLDDDVAAKLKEEMQRSGRSFKQTVNAVLREGLCAPQHRQPPEPFVVKPRDLKARPGIEFDNIGELLEQVEGPSHR